MDIVLENAAGEIVGIEVKASSTVKSSDFKGLKYLNELLGERLVRGIVLYTVDQTRSLWLKPVCVAREHAVAKH